MGETELTDWLERWRRAERRPHQQEPTGPFDEFDLIGRKVPRRLGMPDYLLVIARSEPARVRRVPAAAIVEEDENDAFVKCPCGAQPVAHTHLEKCSGCQRHYIRFESGAVFVAYGDGPAPPLVAPRP